MNQRKYLENGTQCRKRMLKRKRAFITRLLWWIEKPVINQLNLKFQKIQKAIKENKLKTATGVVSVLFFIGFFTHSYLKYDGGETKILLQIQKWVNKSFFSSTFAFFRTNCLIKYFSQFCALNIILKEVNHTELFTNSITVVLNYCP